MIHAIQSCPLLLGGKFKTKTQHSLGNRIIQYIKSPAIASPHEIPVSFPFQFPCIILVSEKANQTMGTILLIPKGQTKCQVLEPKSNFQGFEKFFNLGQEICPIRCLTEFY